MSCTSTHLRKLTVCDLAVLRKFTGPSTSGPTGPAGPEGPEGTTGPEGPSAPAIPPNSLQVWSEAEQSFPGFPSSVVIPLASSSPVSGDWTPNLTNTEFTTNTPGLYAVNYSIAVENPSGDSGDSNAIFLSSDGGTSILSGSLITIANDPSIYGPVSALVQVEVTTTPFTLSLHGSGTGGATTRTVITPLGTGPSARLVITRIG